MSRTYLLADENEAKFVEKTRTWLKKIAELGFIRKLSAEEDKIEVCRIIKAFVDAQWLNEFDARLQEYIDFKKSDEQEAVKPIMLQQQSLEFVQSDDIAGFRLQRLELFNWGNISQPCLVTYS